MNMDTVAAPAPEADLLAVKELAEARRLLVA